MLELSFYWSLVLSLFMDVKRKVRFASSVAQLCMSSIVSFCMLQLYAGLLQLACES